MIDDLALRLVVVLVLVVAVVGIALATRRWQRPLHLTVDIERGRFDPGLLLFTSTDCGRCREALTVVKTSSLPLREVTWELEPQVIEELGVEAVPMAVAIDAHGVAVDQIVGVPSQKWLRRIESQIRLG